MTTSDTTFDFFVLYFFISAFGFFGGAGMLFSDSLFIQVVGTVLIFNPLLTSGFLLCASFLADRGFFFRD